MLIDLDTVSRTSTACANGRAVQGRRYPARDSLKTCPTPAIGTSSLRARLLLDTQFVAVCFEPRNRRSSRADNLFKWRTTAAYAAPELLACAFAVAAWTFSVHTVVLDQDVIASCQAALLAAISTVGIWFLRHRSLALRSRSIRHTLEVTDFRGVGFDGLLRLLTPTEATKREFELRAEILERAVLSALWYDPTRPKRVRLRDLATSLRTDLSVSGAGDPVRVRTGCMLERLTKIAACPRAVEPGEICRAAEQGWVRWSPRAGRHLLSDTLSPVSNPTRSAHDAV
jgi:hypothetical protein